MLYIYNDENESIIKELQKSFNDLMSELKGDPASSGTYTRPGKRHYNEGKDISSESFGSVRVIDPERIKLLADDLITRAKHIKAKNFNSISLHKD